MDDFSKRHAHDSNNKTGKQALYGALDLYVRVQVGATQVLPQPQENLQNKPFCHGISLPSLAARILLPVVRMGTAAARHDHRGLHLLQQCFRSTS
ncbi:hypothetical protein [Noviherbaspirillum agri]